MTVLYYTQSYYLDAAIETIKSMQGSGIKMHLVIEVTPDSMRTNILNIKNSTNEHSFTCHKEILGEEYAALFEPYFKELASVNMLVFKQSKAFSFDTFLAMSKLVKFIFKIKPKAIHFDTVTLRSILLVPFLLRLKKIITIHDPLVHIGEKSWKTSLTKKIFFSIADDFIFYSNYAKKQFEENFKYLRNSKHLLKFQPYTFNHYYKQNASLDKDAHILFFGRISYYKGIDLLLESIPIILQYYPNQLFVIAGKSDGYQLDHHYLKKYEHNIILLDRYINPKEAVHLIQQSKFLICPYRDASQSGVLMTAKAIGKPVIATNVGAFSEYIEDGYNGLIAAPNKEAIADRMLYCLDQNRFKFYEKNIDKYYSQNLANTNQKVLIRAYLTNSIRTQCLQ